MKVNVTYEYLKCIQKLGSNSAAKAAVELLKKLRDNSQRSGLNIETLNNVPNNVRSVRINDGLRAIGVYTDDTLTLVYCGAHDETYRWMVGKDYKRLSEGSFEITDDIEMSRFAANSEPKESQCHIPIFDGYSTEELISFGLSAEQADLLKEIKDEKLYQLIRAMFTGYQATVIEMCEAGFTGDEIREWLATECESETVVKDTVCDGVFVIDDDNSVEEFRKAVNGKIEPWRLFLHPSQEKYAFGNFSGAVYVCGEAGTGKTVAAIHRAKHLAERIEGAERILVTTFTKNLAMDISDMLDKMCTYNRDRIDVVNIDNLATRLFGIYFPNYSIMYDKTVDELWNELIARNQIEERFNLSFFKKEWERLIIPENITTLDSYISADRTGLGYPMNRRQRAAAWTVLENFRESCSKAVEKNLAYKMLSDKLRSSGEIYIHIIADEVQDFSAAMLELLSVLSGGQHENDIYLTGDPSQNLYGKNVHLRKCGIIIANRRYQLRVNYRTTEEIERFALCLLGDTKYYETRTLSLTHAKAPETVSTDDYEKMLEYINRAVRTEESLCIVAAKSNERDNISKFLNENGIENMVIGNNTTSPGSKTCIATMKRVKGLEFDNIIIWGLEKWILDGSERVFNSDAATSKEIERTIRSEAYVAATRARKGLVCFVRTA